MFLRQAYHCLNMRKRSFIKIGIQTLYSKSSLGIDNFAINQKKFKMHPEQSKEFKEKMKSQIDSEKNLIIYKNDLKQMIYTCDSSEDDLNLVVRMSKLFHSQEGARIDDFTFGTELVRLFYVMDRLDMALEAFKDAEFDGFFHQISSYSVIMDFLYESLNFEEVLSLMDHVLTLNVPFSRNCFTIAIASCFKMNSPESLEKGIEYFQKAKDHGVFVHYKPANLIIALALKQAKPETALEIIDATSHHRDNSLLLNLKAIALSEIGHISGAFLLLKKILTLQPSSSDLYKLEFFRETEEAIKNKIQANDGDLLPEIDSFFQHLKSRNLISEQSMDAILCQPILASKKQLAPRDRNKEREMLQAAFRRGRAR